MPWWTNGRHVRPRAAMDGLCNARSPPIEGYGICASGHGRRNLFTSTSTAAVAAGGARLVVAREPAGARRPRVCAARTGHGMAWHGMASSYKVSNSSDGAHARLDRLDTSTCCLHSVCPVRGLVAGGCDIWRTKCCTVTMPSLLGNTCDGSQSHRHVETEA